jgi:hypothetical protein
VAFTPASTEAVTAAQTAAKTAERTRAAECGNGEPKQRGKFCREREADERAAADKLVAVLANKAATDKAAKLDREAAEISARLSKTPAVKNSNALGEALGRLLPWLPAASAATFQQGLVSAVAELLIAAALALPELLHKPTHAAKREEDLQADPEKIEAPAKSKPRFVVANQPKAGSVPDIMADVLKPAKGGGASRLSTFSKPTPQRVMRSVRA